MKKTPVTAIRAEGAIVLQDHLLNEMREGRLVAGVKLPSERELATQFNTARGTVRRVLANLMEQGLVTQSHGRGTFATEAATALHQQEENTQEARIFISPAELMEARLMIEPLLPSLIARNATASDFARMRECIEESEAAVTIDEFEYWDGELHKTFAMATRNSFFLQILNLMNEVREQGEWGRLKRHSLTPELRSHYETQHRAIVAALTDRDAERGRQLMAEHLEQIQMNLFGR